MIDKDMATRIESKVRELYDSKHPKNIEHLLAYGWGKVHQQIDVNDVSDKPDSELVLELQHLLDAARARAGASVDGGDTPAGAGGDGDKPT